MFRFKRKPEQMTEEEHQTEYRGLLRELGSQFAISDSPQEQMIHAIACAQREDSRVATSSAKILFSALTEQQQTLVFSAYELTVLARDASGSLAQPEKLLCARNRIGDCVLTVDQIGRASCRERV